MVKRIFILVFLVSALGCGLSYDGRVHHPEGGHHSEPQIVQPIAINVNHAEGSLAFDESCRYAYLPYSGFGTIVFLRQPWFGGTSPAPQDVNIHLSVRYGRHTKRTK